MFRKIAIEVVALAAIAAPLALVATPAEAASSAVPACATRAEFNRVRVGMPVSRTQAIIGGPGRVTIAGSFMSQRQWKVCGSAWSYVTLTFLQGRLDNKILL